MNIGAPVSSEIAMTQLQSSLAQSNLSDTTKKGIEEKAQDFEAMFLSQMLSHMFAGVETSEPFGGGHGEDVFRSFLVQEYGKIMTQSGGIGIADAVAREMIAIQEQENTQ